MKADFSSPVATAEFSKFAGILSAAGSGREEQPKVQGAVAEWAQEGLEELFHVEGQEWWWCGDTPHSR